MREMLGIGAEEGMGVCARMVRFNLLFRCRGKQCDSCVLFYSLSCYKWSCGRDLYDGSVMFRYEVVGETTLRENVLDHAYARDGQKLSGTDRDVLRKLSENIVGPFDSIP